MRLQYPFEIITPTVDGDVLGVLAGADGWFESNSIHELIPTRSDEGIRKTLKRLVAVGIVEELTVGRSKAFRLNRNHLGAEPILQLANLKSRFYLRLAEAMRAWQYPPVYAALFGSAARNSMTTQSDVDLFLLQPDSVELSLWEQQVNELVSLATGWIGTEVRPLLYTESEIRQLGSSETVLEFIATEGISIFGDRNQFLAAMRREQ